MNQWDEENIIIIRNRRAKRSFLGRISNSLGELFIWVLALVPGLFAMVYGIKGVLTKNIVLIGRGGISEPYVAGPHAVGLGWCFFGIGIGFLGNSLYRKIGCIACKVSGFVLGALAVIAGLSIILKN